MKFFLYILILILIIGCGKDNSAGGNSSYGNSASGTSSSANSSRTDGVIIIRNKSTQSIFYLFISKSSEERWGSDRLKDDVILAGRGIKWRSVYCGIRYDVKAVFKDSKEYIKRDIYVSCNSETDISIY